MITIPLLILFNILHKPASCNQLELSQEECSLWYHSGKDGNCTCGDSLDNTVYCSETKDNTLYLRDCFCMTLDSSQREPVVGPCIYTCDYSLKNSSNQFFMTKIESKSLSDINNETCGQFNRQGVLCSKCMDGYGLPFSTYNISCVPCKYSWCNWMKYLATTYLPLTIFVFIVIIFRFSANSGSMVVYVTLSQLMINKNIASLYLVIQNEIHIKIVVALYSMWNLEFLGDFTFSCLHPDLSALPILALDYLVALYPMILVFLTYMLVYWHGRSQMLVCLCRPLYTCLHFFRKEWDIGSSLIEAFATLILLSYVKVMYISCSILASTSYYFMNATKSHSLVYADPSMEYLSSKHAPYFFLAIVMTITFNILPLLLLCMYPCMCFQKILSHFRLHPRFLYTLMDAFRGSYRLKPYCLQSFTAVYLLANFGSIFIYFFLENALYHSGKNFILVALLFLVALIAPYKNKWHNRINTTLTLLALLGNNAINVNLENDLLQNIDHKEWAHFNTVVTYIAYFTLPAYGLCLLCNYFIPIRIKIHIKGYLTTKMFFNMEEKERKPLNISLPHRLQQEDDLIRYSD